MKAAETSARETVMRQTTALDHPRISVVIASVNGPAPLDECLAALEQQTLREQAEIIVADRCGAPVREMVERKHPNVRLISLPVQASIPELRAIGLKSARGDVLAITEDHCLAEPHWLERMVAAHEVQYGVIGGAVENDPHIHRLVDWAVFFCEYSQFENPVRRGVTTDLPGNNISYRREFLPHIQDLLDRGGAWENFLNERLHAKGIRTYSDPSLVVFHKKEFGFGYFLRQRYHYSRGFAGMRTRGAPAWKRLAYALGALLLPLLQIARITARRLRRGRHLGRFALAQPLIWIFSVSWGIGEFVGYLSGAGDSLQRVE